LAPPPQPYRGGATPCLPGSTMQGSTVDPEHRQIFWHAGCDGGYHVTDIDTGETRSFVLDLEQLGIADTGAGFCLAEWAYDAKRNAAIALGGFAIEGRS